MTPSSDVALDRYVAFLCSTWGVLFLLGSWACFWCVVSERYLARISKYVQQSSWWAGTKRAHKRALWNVGFPTTVNATFPQGTSDQMVADMLAWNILHMTMAGSAALASFGPLLTGWEEAGPAGRSVFLVMALQGSGFSVFAALDEFLRAWIGRGLSSLAWHCPRPYWAIQLLFIHPFWLLLLPTMHMNLANFVQFHRLVPTLYAGWSIFHALELYGHMLTDDARATCSSKVVLVMRLAAVIYCLGFLFIMYMLACAEEMLERATVEDILSSAVSNALAAEASLMHVAVIIACARSTFKALCSRVGPDDSLPLRDVDMAATCSEDSAEHRQPSAPRSRGVPRSAAPSSDRQSQAQGRGGSTEDADAREAQARNERERLLERRRLRRKKREQQSREGVGMGSNEASAQAWEEEEPAPREEAQARREHRKQQNARRPTRGARDNVRARPPASQEEQPQDDELELEDGCGVRPPADPQEAQPSAASCRYRMAWDAANSDPSRSAESGVDVYPMLERCNHYELLQLLPDASDADLKRAFHRLSKRWHPDKNPDNPRYAEDVFCAVKEAYEVLISPERRAEYDWTLSARSNAHAI